jgi:hypothetical protein
MSQMHRCGNLCYNTRNELVQPNKLCNNWAIFASRNGGADGKDKKKFKGFQDKKKSYADKGITHKEFGVGDHVFLKVKARRSSLKLGNCLS